MFEFQSAADSAKVLQTLAHGVCADIHRLRGGGGGDGVFGVVFSGDGKMNVADAVYVHAAVNGAPANIGGFGKTESYDLFVFGDIAP